MEILERMDEIVIGWISVEAKEMLDSKKDLIPVFMAGGQLARGFSADLLSVRFSRSP